MSYPGAPIDLAMPDEACEIVASQKPAAVIHCAALTNVDYCEKQPEEAETINAIASGRLAAAARKTGARFVYISTDAVFDGTKGSYDENSTPAPVNAYARSKWHGEQQVMDAYESSLVIRTNLYGWNAQPNKKSLMEWVLSLAEQNTRIPGFVDVIFAPLPAHKLAQLILLGIDRQLEGLFHMAASDSVSKYDFARKVLGVFGFDTNLVFESRLQDASFTAPRPARTSLVATKLEKTLNISMQSIEEGLHECKILRDTDYLSRLKKLIGVTHHA